MSELIFEEVLKGYKFQTYKKKPDFDLIHVHQVHGSIVNLDTEVESGVTEADGIMSIALKTPLAIKTADCLPIIVIGKKGVANLHAGWRGVHLKIAQSSELEALEPFFFYIGPHIQTEHFQVQKEFKENFPASSHFKEIGGKLYFNLAAEVSDQIHMNWPEAEVQVSGLSTFGNPRFHSYREDGTKERNWNILSIEG